MGEDKRIIDINIDDILPNRFQPRIKFNEASINELAESIRLHGVIQPIVVRKISDKYEIIAGERRYKASIIAGKTTIPAIVTTLDDRNSAEVALIENVQRQDLTPIEEAISYKKILDMGYLSQSDLGLKLGKKQSTIANKLRLLNLNDEVQEALMDNKISERHARSLLRLDDKKQTLMLNRIINERLTVRKADEEIDKMIAADDSSAAKEIIDEKGDNMNNDILKEFNIPTEPIVDEKPTIPNVPTEPVQEQPTINPGFMDVDRIQNVAQDIVKPEQPLANMDMLLKSEPTMEQSVQPQIEPIEEVQEQPEPTGKFFNMFNFTKPVTEADESEFEQQKVNMNFEIPKSEPNLNIFGQSDNKVEEPVQPQVAPTIEQPIDTTNFNNVVSEPDLVNFDREEPVINANIESSDTVTPDSVFTNAIEPMTLTDDEDFSEPVQSQEEQQPFAFQPEPQANSTIEQPTFGFEAEPQSPTIEEVQPLQQPVAPQPMPEMVSTEPVRPYMMDSSVTFDDDGEIEVKLPQNDMVQPKVDMKTIINTIRECQSKIEQFGYKVDTDELDLPDVYEVTFRIEK